MIKYPYLSTTRPGLVAYWVSMRESSLVHSLAVMYPVNLIVVLFETLQSRNFLRQVPCENFAERINDAEEFAAIIRFRSSFDTLYIRV
jgi:hypothetical protein